MKYLPQFFPAFWTVEYEVFGLPFTDEICIGFVERKYGGYSYLLNDEFVKLKIKPKDLLKISINNLENEIENCNIKVYKLGSGSIAFWCSMNDNFTAVRFLSHKYLSLLKKIFNNDFYFSIPHRDLITCWQTMDKDEMEKYENETIEDFDNSDYKLSKKVYRFDEIQLI